jgi:peptidyl-prolyl cis-trans isomerase SurA
MNESQLTWGDMAHQHNIVEVERRISHRASRVGSWLLAGSVVLSAGVALAQSGQPGPSIPGLVITTTPPAPHAPAAPPSAEPTPEPPKAATKRALPKSRQASTEPAASGRPTRGSGRRQGIVVLVNDEPITGYEVDQRATLLSLSTNISERAQAAFKRLAQDPSINDKLRAILEATVKANHGKSREQILAIFEERKKAFVLGIQRSAVESARASMLPGLREKALEEIIDEKLKVQEGKRLTIVVTPAEVDKAFKEMAERNKSTEEKFIEQLKSQGIHPDTMKARTRAALVWRDVIRRKFGAQISVTDREIDRFVQQSPDEGAAKVEMQLHRITLAVPGKIDQAALARRLAEAERLRRRFSGCRTTQELAKSVPDAKFESLAHQAASAVSEPTRSLLLNARDGEMVPPTLASTGVELYAVCGRKTVKMDEETRLKAQQELTMREFDVLSRRHLRDLRTDALIERR